MSNEQNYIFLTKEEFIAVVFTEHCESLKDFHSKKCKFPPILVKIVRYVSTENAKNF